MCCPQDIGSSSEMVIFVDPIALDLLWAALICYGLGFAAVSGLRGEKNGVDGGVVMFANAE